MLSRKPVYLLLSSVTFSANAINTLPDNEQICLQEMEKLISEQLVLFSDSQSSQEVRRNAERAIDYTREAFAKNGSYCEARRALQTYETDQESGLRMQKGEVNYFGRGNF